MMINIKHNLSRMLDHMAASTLTSEPIPSRIVPGIYWKNLVLNAEYVCTSQLLCYTIFQGVIATINTNTLCLR